MNCHNCGFSLPDDSEFCPYCGVKVEQMDYIAELQDKPIKRRGPALTILCVLLALCAAFLAAVCLHYRKANDTLIQENTALSSARDKIAEEITAELEKLQFYQTAAEAAYFLQDKFEYTDLNSRVDKLIFVSALESYDERIDACAKSCETLSEEDNTLLGEYRLLSKQFADYLNASSSEGQTIQFLAEPREGAKCRPL